MTAIQLINGDLNLFFVFLEYYPFLLSHWIVEVEDKGKSFIKNAKWLKYFEIMLFDGTFYQLCSDNFKNINTSEEKN
jgi:hypothetical protein